MKRIGNQKEDHSAQIDGVRLIARRYAKVGSVGQEENWRTWLTVDE